MVVRPPPGEPTMAPQNIASELTKTTCLAKGEWRRGGKVLQGFGIHFLKGKGNSGPKKFSGEPRATSRPRLPAKRDSIVARRVGSSAYRFQFLSRKSLISRMQPLATRK